MKEYELILVTKTDIKEDAFENIKNRMETIIKNNNGEIQKIENLGKKRLAYTIKKSTKGIFYCVSYKATGDVMTELQSNLNIDENVIRYQCNILQKTKKS